MFEKLWHQYFIYDIPLLLLFLYYVRNNKLKKEIQTNTNNKKKLKTKKMHSSLFLLHPIKLEVAV